MNRSSLRLVVSAALSASAALLACSAPSDISPAEERVAQTTEALRKCKGPCDEPADPTPAPTPKPRPTATSTPPPPPPPIFPGVGVGGNGGVLAPMDYSFSCNDATHRLVYFTMGPDGKPVPSNVPECWTVAPVHCAAVPRTAQAVSSSSSGAPPPTPDDGSECTGYTLVSQSFCALGLTMRCNPLQYSCTCSW